ncbi:MAG: PEP-CTERM sorting domain-containing protein [Blastochloris sp.]|nr:PEP-CTERM sorting domain-containing protein [Blastochloris sp.]
MNSAFDFIDGAAPNTTGTNFSGGAGLQREASTASFSFTAPMNADGSNNTLIVWFSAQKLNTNGMNLQFFDGVTQIGSTLFPTITTGDRKNLWIYEFEYGGADSARDMTFTFNMTSGSQSDSRLALHGAALTVVPEPSTYALLGLGLGTLWLLRRKRQA